MAIEEVIIPYPDFILGEIIDPDQFDLNNDYMVRKTNEIVDLLNVITDSVKKGGSGADKISLTPIEGFASNKLQKFLEEVIAKLKSAAPGASGADFIAATPITGVTGGNVMEQLNSLKSLFDAVKLTADTNKTGLAALKTDYDAHKANKSNPHGTTAAQVGAMTALETQNLVKTHGTSADHDSRYYTKNQLDGGQLDTRYYTKQFLDGKLRGGDTMIRYDVYIIENPNIGDGTFSYKDKSGNLFVGDLTPEGYQKFRLRSGFYNLGLNRIKATVNDTLHRSPASGGLREDTETTIILTQPEGSGAEITFEYFERVGLTGEHASSHADGGSDEVKGLLYVDKFEPKGKFAGKLWGRVL